MMERITDRIYYLPHDDHGDRPVLGYVRGDRYALMIDAGNGAEHVALYDASLAEAGLPRPDFCAITHWHWDHTFGIHALGCPAIACEQTNLYLEDVARWAWTDEAMAQRLASGEDNEFCDREIRVAYPDRAAITVRKADITFADILTLDLGGVHCRLLHIENPHTADGVIVHVPEAGVVFLGDADCQGNHHGRQPLYLAKLAGLLPFMERLNFTLCVMGHDAPVSREALLAEWRTTLRG